MSGLLTEGGGALKTVLLFGDKRSYDGCTMKEELKKGENVLKEAKAIHFIGIGGIGISAVARMMILEGKNVSGSDASESIVTKELKKLGAKIYKSHNPKNISKNIDLVIYSKAIQETNPEFEEAKKRGLAIISYPESLKIISKDKYTIAIAGTHGKTTTTAMVGKILEDAKFKPTIIVGSLLKSSGSNLKVGKSKYFVVEADEYKRAFLNLTPKILIITNIEADHLDYYKDLEDVQSAFRELVGKMDKDTVLICNTQMKSLQPIIKIAKCKIFHYGDVGIDLPIKVMGKHNLENAKAACAVGMTLNISKDKIVKSLKNFSGTWRRQEYLGKALSGAFVYDDYAHHPTEIEATLNAFREKFPKNKITAVFMPHLFSRTKQFLKEFGTSFKEASQVVLADIFPAREVDDGTIHSKDLLEEIKQYVAETFYIGDMREIEKFLKKYAKKGDVILTMGAGDIYKVAERLVKRK